MRSMSRVLLVALTLVTSTISNDGVGTTSAFAPSLSSFRSETSSSRLRDAPNPRDDDDDENGGGEDRTATVSDRFLRPRIDDRGLVLADALVAQVVAPTAEIAWLSLAGAPRPSWLRPLFLSSSFGPGGVLAPTLVHGADLALCWTAGALAAEAYERGAFDVSSSSGGDYGVVVSRVLRAGAFATGLLVLSTQARLFFELGFVRFGEGGEAVDLRLLTTAAELVNDVFFEAVVLTSWRLYRASLTANR